MTKITKLVVASTILSSTLYATSTSDVHIGVSNAKIENENYAEFNIGLGYNKYFDSNILFGTSFDLAYGSPKLANKSIDLYTVSADVKLGYALFDKKLSIYAIGSAAAQLVDDTEAGGFGYGAGVDYRFTDKFALNVEYKTYNMNTSSFDYDYKKTGVNLKYIF